jgi:UDP-galactopyranose mutase
MMNSSLREEPWTRTYEWAYLPPNPLPTAQSVSIVTKEFAVPFGPGIDPLYPVRTEEMVARATQYRQLTTRTPKYHVGGRLGTFQYYDMHQAMTAAMSCADRLLKGERTDDEYA